MRDSCFRSFWYPLGRVVGGKRFIWENGKFAENVTFLRNMIIKPGKKPSYSDSACKFIMTHALPYVGSIKLYVIHSIDHFYGEIDIFLKSDGVLLWHNFDEPIIKTISD
jgi:hypothetical protein